MPKTRSAILHIGCEKTGTSAIQALLAAKRQELPQYGVWYPVAPGSESHTALASFAAPANSTDITGPHFDPDRFVQEFADEMAAMPETIHTVIFSNEHCHSRLVTRDQVARLHALLAPHVSRIEVLVYLRRQDEMACSFYSTRLRYGEMSYAILPPVTPSDGAGGMPADASLNYYFDFDALLERYAGIFGAEAMRPRLYEPDATQGGDVVADFLASCGLPASLNPGPVRRNPALPAEFQAFLSGLNRHLASANDDTQAPMNSELRDFCIYVAEQYLSGQPRRPARAQAQAFYRQFAASNERVRRRWFPGRDQLFSDCFAQYPETQDASEAARNAEALRAAFQIVAGMFVEIRENERIAREQMAAVAASTSWRLTAPLRAVSALRPAVRRQSGR